MYQDKIVLSVQDILEKEFKFDTRGYRPQEVDKFLDLVIRDYEEMTHIIKDLEQDKKEFAEETMRLKAEIRTLKTKLDMIKESGMETGNVSNADLLRRLSNLEKIIYGKED